MNKCPNCGSDIKEGAKFCTSCGYQLVQGNVNNTVNTTNTTNVNRARQTVDTDRMKEVSMSYWDWLVTSWKHPFKVEAGEKYTGLVTLAIEGVMFALSVMILVRKIAGAFVESSNSIMSFFSGGSSSNTSNPVGFNVFVVFFLAVFIAALAIIGAVLLIEKGFSDSNKEYLDLVNEVAHKTSSLVLLNAVLFVYSFIVSNASVNSVVLIDVVLGLMSMIWVIGILSVAFELKETKMDNIYVGLVIYIAHMIIVSIAGWIVVNHYASMLTDVISELIGAIQLFEMWEIAMSENRFCPNCGQKVDASEKFCANCGYQLSENVEKVEENKSFESPNPTEVSQSTEQFSQSNNNNYNRPKKPINKKVMIPVVVLVVLIGAYIAGNKYYSSQNQLNRFVTALSSNDGDVSGYLTTTESSKSS